MNGPTPIISSIFAEVAPKRPNLRANRGRSFGPNGISYHTGALRTVLLLFALVARLGLAQSPLERAVQLTREKRYGDAAKLLEDVAEPTVLSQRIAFHRLRAAIDSGLGENVAAANEMRTALQLTPNDTGLQLATAVAEAQAGFLDDAARHAEQAGNTAAGKVLLGDIEEKRGDYARAVAAYQAAVRAAPSEEQYRLDLAFEWIKHQNFGAAINLLARSKPLFPHSAKIRTLLGIAEYGEGQIQDAETTLKEAIQCDPKLDSAYQCLARIVLQSSAAPPDDIVRSLCSWNQVVCSALQLRVAREAGNTELANQALARLAASPDQSAVAVCERARGLEWAGQLEDARKSMEACVKLDPIPQNHYRLAQLYGKLGLTERARQELETRRQILQSMSEQTALGLSALQTLDTVSR